jgi:uncharacterized membrane protein
VVSLEAIFLSTFVMIGQNRQSAYQQAKAEHDFNEEELELRANTALTREVHVLVQKLLEERGSSSEQLPRSRSGACAERS